ncbi:MAG: tRNA (cytidine(34)-2'-O)-methyltransferase [Syntrophobacterales bacterium]|nr:tRNA (cytidine(34)-2'-O)-methyltransferase [Syntrophobacterales bacterium]
MGSQNRQLRVVLYQPEIPQNTGNIARTCAATHIPLHLIEPLGFQLSDRHLKRAGLDYWPHVELHVHRSFEEFLETINPSRCILYSTRGTVYYDEISYKPGDCLVFGSETQGLPGELIFSGNYTVAYIPIDRSKVRSLNLSTAVGIALFEALRQIGQLRAKAY